MTENDAQRRAFSFGTIAYVSPFYFISVGVLYLWAYWGSFQINILEHTGIADVVKAAAEPIASTFFFWIVGSIIGQYVGTADESTDQTEEGASSEKASRRLRLSVAVFSLSFVALGIFLTSRAMLWLVLPMVAAAFAYRLPPDWFDSVVPRHASRRLLIALAIALPFFAFAQGKLRADEIELGRKFTYLFSIWPNVKDAAATAEESPRLLGRAGENLFFLLPKNGAIAVVLAKEGTIYHLKHFKESVTPGQRAKEWFISIQRTNV